MVTLTLSISIILAIVGYFVMGYQHRALPYHAPVVFLVLMVLSPLILFTILGYFSSLILYLIDDCYEELTDER